MPNFIITPALSSKKRSPLAIEYVRCRVGQAGQKQHGIASQNYAFDGRYRRNYLDPEVDTILIRLRYRARTWYKGKRGDQKR